MLLSRMGIIGTGLVVALIAGTLSADPPTPEQADQQRIEEARQRQREIEEINRRNIEEANRRRIEQFRRMHANDLCSSHMRAVKKAKPRGRMNSCFSRTIARHWGPETMRPRHRRNRR